ncbi:cupin domain-containing protein [Wenjunlia tyrosinilytica]|uniref:Cupin type-2 domain-containing protein n=1 Tax=Wenjunlia tyrosinilytica TaxID=1544741 RepID=A0A917ZTG5_9ACTN|nr:cupin domain-containing protein [Wenjunlia tyrosinilytica]GGO89821.1 hypothetical protein GCM10012280_33950 [Wenjunlia tyrosinilytica]
MPVIRHAHSRRTETPNAVMTTLASPTQGDAAGLAVWRVDMRTGQSGPAHSFDTEQVWTVLEGGATVELDGESFAVEPGDTVVIPADVARRVHCDNHAGFAAIVAARSGAGAYAPSVAAPTACAALDGGKLIPAWIA